MQMRTFACLSIVAALAACGGGGGDDPAPGYLAGTYNATLTKTQDNCFIGGVYNGAQHVVAIEGSRVNVQVNTLAMKGRATDEGGLTATYENRVDGAVATATLTYTFPAGVSAPGNGTFNADLTVKAVATNGFTCTLQYLGTVRKVG
jgi:hypothetical protein